MNANLSFYGEDGNLFQSFEFKLQFGKRVNATRPDDIGLPSIPAGKLKFKLDDEKFEFDVDLPMVKSPLKSIGGITLVAVNSPTVSTIGYVNERTLIWDLDTSRQLIINLQRFNPDPAIDYVGNKLCVYYLKSLGIVKN